jgi:hypothetical protein
LDVASTIADFDSVERKRERLAKAKLDLELDQIKDLRTKVGVLNTYKNKDKEKKDKELKVLKKLIKKK